MPWSDWTAWSTSSTSNTSSEESCALALRGLAIRSDDLGHQVAAKQAERLAVVELKIGIDIVFAAGTDRQTHDVAVEPEDSRKISDEQTDLIDALFHLTSPNSQTIPPRLLSRAHLPVRQPSNG
ncbi:MAG: hypothetical protein IPK19_00570 [Chloroflexi bacterium]|nr:hypothetical protein [Chloroflexota bacterium]